MENGITYGACVLMLSSQTTLTKSYTTLAEKCSHLPDAAPPFLRTVRQTPRKLKAMFAAVFWAFLDANKLRSRSLYCRLVKGGRLATKSFMSSARFCRRIHAQNRSTGLKSGDLGGICYRFTFATRCASLDSEA